MYCNLLIMDTYYVIIYYKPISFGYHLLFFSRILQNFQRSQAGSNLIVSQLLVDHLQLIRLQEPNQVIIELHCKYNMYNRVTDSNSLFYNSIRSDRLRGKKSITNVDEPICVPFPHVNVNPCPESLSSSVCTMTQAHEQSGSVCCKKKR